MRYLLSLTIVVVNAMENLTVDILLRMRANLEERDWKILKVTSTGLNQKVREGDELLRPAFARHTCM